VKCLACFGFFWRCVWLFNVLAIWQPWVRVSQVGSC